MKIAIIGAGFSGMLAAYLLEKRGIDVTVYEKQDRIGGHCQTLVSHDVHAELGTTVSFSKQLKPLLIELKLDYTEQFIYRNFIDKDFNIVEHMSPDNVTHLMNELSCLKEVLKPYESELSQINYGYVPKELMLPLCQFLSKHHLNTIRQIVAPHLSSFGFGNMCDIQAYYTFKVFSPEVIDAFIKGEKLLYLKKGTSDLITKLSHNIKDVRCSLEVTNCEVIGNQVKIDTTLDTNYYDHVLVSTKLPSSVIKDRMLNQLMKKIHTNPFMTCAFEVDHKNLVTTYYKANLGQFGKIQFFHAYRQHHRTILVAFAYGLVNKTLIKAIREDLEQSDITIKHLITAKQWYIFPHLNADNLTQNFYEDIHEYQKDSPITFIGSLISKPDIGNLYMSVKSTVDQLTVPNKH